MTFTEDELPFCLHKKKKGGSQERKKNEGKKRQLKSWEERPLSFIQLGFIFTCRCISKIGIYSIRNLIFPQSDFKSELESI